MQKKSIQTKIMRLIVAGILLSAILIGGTSLYSFQNTIDKDSAQIMNLICEERAQELNDLFGRIEQSVDIMSVYTVENLESIDRLMNDKAYHEEYLEHLADLAHTIIAETEGAVAFYVRLNPNITFPTAGFFHVKNAETGELEEFELTDLSKYDPSDREHVGWYYEPVEAGHAIWMDPYYNKNIDVHMISYVVPVYKDDRLLGIVGMDIDFSYITDMVDNIQVYDTGYAFLVNQDFVIDHSKEFEAGTTVRGFSDALEDVDMEKLTDDDCLYECSIGEIERKVAFCELSNGKIIAVMAPSSEIDRGAWENALRSILITMVITLVFILLALRSASSIIRPLQVLDLAAKEIAAGNLEVAIDIRTQDEVGTLAESLKETAKQLKTRIDYINNLAYMDKLTGVKNNTAYLHDVALLKQAMETGEIQFSLFVIDVNGLKAINDNYGHEAGNELIITAVKIAANVFERENVYRIGGDEFAIILLDTPSEACIEYKNAFMEELETQAESVQVSAAIGSSTYNKKKDISYENVFKRADEEMYANKQAMKQNGRTSRWLKAE